MLCNYHFNIKISSLGLMFKHKKLDSNYLTKHIFSQKYNFENTISGIVKPSVTIPERLQINGSLSEPEIHGHSRPNAYQANIQYTNQHNLHPNNPYPRTVQKRPLKVSKEISNNSVPCFETDQTAPHDLIQPKH